jgi:hypothetical protein
MGKVSPPFILLVFFFTNVSFSFGGEEYAHVRKELNGHFSGPIAGPH